MPSNSNQTAGPEAHAQGRGGSPPRCGHEACDLGEPPSLRSNRVLRRHFGHSLVHLRELPIRVVSVTVCGAHLLLGVSSHRVTGSPINRSWLLDHEDGIDDYVPGERRSSADTTHEAKARRGFARPLWVDPGGTSALAPRRLGTGGPNARKWQSR